MSHSDAVVATCQSVLEEFHSNLSYSRLTVIYSWSHLETTRSSWSWWWSSSDVDVPLQCSIYHLKQVQYSFISLNQIYTSAWQRISWNGNHCFCRRTNERILKCHWQNLIMLGSCLRSLLIFLRIELIVSNTPTDQIENKTCYTPVVWWKRAADQNDRNVCIDNDTVDKSIQSVGELFYHVSFTHACTDHFFDYWLKW